MMEFTCTFRDKSGAIRETVIAAENRTACIAECRRRGITPFKVKEGSNVEGRGTFNASSGGKSSKRKWGVCIILVVIVLLSGVAFWAFSAHEKKPPATKEQVRPKAVKPKNVISATTQKVQAVESPIKTVPPKDTYLGQAVVSRSCVTNEDGSVREIIRTADGKSHGIRYPAPGSEPIFRNAADQAIAMALSVSDTVSAAPFPGMDGDLDAEFAKAVKTPIEISDDDPQPVKDLKKAVMETREEIMRLMEKGQSFSQVLKEHIRLSSENYDIRLQSYKELKALVDAGDMDSAEKYRERVNKVLGEMGITKLDMPMTAEEKAAQREAIRQARERIRKEKSK